MPALTVVDRLVEATKRVVDPQHHSQLTGHSLLFEEKILDSFGVIQLVAEVEREFAIQIATEDLVVQNFGSIDDIAVLVGRRLEAAGR